MGVEMTGRRPAFQPEIANAATNPAPGRAEADAAPENASETPSIFAECRCEAGQLGASPTAPAQQKCDLNAGILAERAHPHAVYYRTHAQACAAALSQQSTLINLCSPAAAQPSDKKNPA
jgi:hypothetical protein